MDVRLSDEQRALRDAAVSVVTKLGPGSVADLDDGARADRLDSAIAAAGWRDLRAADENNLPIASAVESALVAEELGRGLADAAYLGPVLAADLRRIAGSAMAEQLETVALTSDLSALADRGAGLSSVAVDARGSRHALFLAGAVGQQHQVVSASLQPDVIGVDLTRRVVVVDSDSAETEPVGEVAADDLVRWTALGLALACADLVGVMRGAIETAVEYAGTRRQYDAAVGSFQAVQHLLADAQVAMEGSRSIALHAAWAVDALEPAEALGAAAAAKAYCARAARSVCETSIQVHGGIGNTWECRAHLYLRRALVSSDLLGNVGVSLQRVLDHERGAGHGLR